MASNRSNIPHAGIAGKDMKRTAINQRGQSTRSRLEKECDALWQQAIRIVWNGRCGLCGCQQMDNEGCGHHVIPKDNKPTRHCVMNGVFLCIDCHVPKAHADKRAFLLFLSKKWKAHYDWHMENKAPTTDRISEEELRETRAELTAFIKENKS